MDSSTATLGDGEKSDLEHSRPSSARNTKSELDERINASGRLSTASKDETLHEQLPKSNNDERSEDYPDATRMIFIVIALVLSIFLVNPDRLHHIHGS